MGRRRRSRPARTLLVLLLLTLLLAAAYVYAGRLQGEAGGAGPAPAGTLRVHYVDVGQGDGTLWELPDGSLLVYDCGPPAEDAASNPLVRYLEDELHRAPGTTIRALVASHGHLDHVGGCDEVLDAYVFEHVYDADYQGDDAPESYRRFRAKAEAEGATLHALPSIQPGAVIDVGPASATVLWPRGFAPGGWDAIAESSLVVRLVHGARSFCFQGDIETAQEAALTGECDVYLVGHHGSRYASSEAWLARMEPDIAVASFGENSYGHPTPEAFCRIQQAGATIYTTQRSGGVVVETDGSSLRIVRGEAETADYCA